MANIVSHGECGKTWRQRGNTTGHCGRCHETFEGAETFDAHQRLRRDGSVTCLRASEVSMRGCMLVSREPTRW